MGVKSNLPEVRARRQAVFAGDEGRVKAQKDLGKLTARERLTALFDAASFVELNALNEGDSLVDFVGPLGTPSKLEGLKKVAVVGGGAALMRSHRTLRWAWAR